MKNIELTENVDEIRLHFLHPKVVAVPVHIHLGSLFKQGVNVSGSLFQCEGQVKVFAHLV